MADDFFVGKNLAAALSLLQTKLPEVKKTEKGQAGNRETRYADLANISAAILPLLGELGLSFSARPTLNAAGAFVLEYELLHVSGESRTGQYPLRGDGPQALGSAITYARRYTLCAITGLAPEGDDDDAAAAQSERLETKRAPARRPRSAQREESHGNDQAEYPRLGPQEPGQQRKVFALWRDLGYQGEDKREERLAITSKIVGHEVASTADLNYNDMATLINALQKRLRETAGGGS